jgi:hypothetical protein
MPSAAYLLVQVVALVFVWGHGFRVWQKLATGLADVGTHDGVSIPAGSVIWTLVGFAVAMTLMGVMGRWVRRGRSAADEESPLLIHSATDSESWLGSVWRGVSVGDVGRGLAGRWGWLVAALLLVGLLYYLVPPLAVLLTVTIPALILLALIAGTSSQLSAGWLGMLAFLSFLTTFLVGAVETGLDRSDYGYSLMMMAMTVSFLIGLPLSWSAHSR